MRFLLVVSAAALASAAITTNVPRDVDMEESAQQAIDMIDDIKANVLKSLDEREAELAKRGETATCNARNVAFRRE